jgi:putative ABC transport system permease protein
MRRLVFSALRARPGQSVVLFLLATLALAAGTAAPMYAAAAGRAVRLHELDAATAADRVISVRGSVQAADDLDRIEPVRRQLRDATSGSGLTDLLSIDLRGQLLPEAVAVTLTTRDDMCAHLVVTGRCAQAAGEAVVAPARAKALNVGDQISVTASGLEQPLLLRVVGTYQARDAAEAYWAGQIGIAGTPDDADAPIFVTKQTLLGAKPRSVDVRFDLVALDAAALSADPAPLRAAGAAIRNGAPSGFTVTTRLSNLVSTVDDSQDALTNGVVVGAGQLILICGFVLLLAVGHAAVERRPQAALAALRGAPTRHRFLLAVGPNAVLTLAAGPVGFAIGWLAVAVAGRFGFDDRVPVEITPATYAVAGGTLLLVLAVSVIAEWRAHSGGLLEALRQTPPRRRGWRGGVVDLLVVTLGIAAAYQLGSGATESVIAGSVGVAALAPMLVALACGLVAGRLVLPVAVAVGAAQLRRGRLATGLAALQLARRPAAHRLLALVTIAVALLGQAVSGLDTASQAAQARARLELGADRVLTVDAASPAAVLAVVHSVDPAGRWAMAAVRQQVGAQTAVAVEADRLASVAHWPRDTGLPPVSEAAAALRPPTNPTITVTGRELLLDTSGPQVPTTVRLVRADGTSFDAGFTAGRGGGGRGSLGIAEVPGCAPAGCRLAWFSFPTSPDGMQLRQLRQTGPDQVLIDGATFASAGRWRPGFNTGTTEVTVLHGPDWLGARYRPADPRSIAREIRILAADAPVPMPVMVAGPASIAQTGEVREVPGLSAGLQSVDVVAAARGLPGVGGAGYLVDNEYASRLSSEPPDSSDGSASYQVWLARGAPTSIVDQLGDRLTVRGEETVRERNSQLLGRGSGQAARLNLLAALLGLVLAATAIVVVAALERGRRLAELRALRVQGLPARVAAASGLLNYAGLVAGGVLAGVVAAAASWAAVRKVVPAFVDGWTVTTVPDGPRPVVAVLAFLLATAALLGVAALVARPIGKGTKPT